MKEPRTHSTGTPCPYRWGYEEKKIPRDNLGALKVVVGGFPRTSTTWFTNILRDLRLDCKKPGYVTSGHEALFTPDLGFRDNQIDSISVDVTGFAGPYLADLRERGVVVIHLMRHPVDTINSTLNYFDHYFPAPKKDYWPWVVKTWYDWQTQWAKYAHETIFFERRVEGVQRIGEHLGMSWSAEEIEQRGQKTKRGRSSAGSVGNWGELPEEVQKFAESYGYTDRGLVL